MIYRTLFYVNIYGSYKLLKTVQFLAHPVFTSVGLCVYAFMHTCFVRGYFVIF